MEASIKDRLSAVPLKTLKVGLVGGEGGLNLVESAGQAVSVALARAGISQKAAALEMDINEGQFTRQLRGQEHLSWQRLFRLSDAFWLELVFVVAEMRGVARVRRTLEERVG